MHINCLHSFLRFIIGIWVLSCPFFWEDLTNMTQYDKLFPTINLITASGKIRTSPADFQVNEQLSVDFTHQGEHLWLLIEKTSTNTNWVAKQLATICQVPQKQVGYAGLKDRHAITTQWFSVQLAKVTDKAKIQAALPNEIVLLKLAQHNKKIKTGQLDGNRFNIIVRDVVGDKKQIEENIKHVISNGAPNYFGTQRFGNGMGNIQKAKDWFTGSYKVKTRNLKSLLISTARSHIFNLIVAKRINQGLFNQVMKGDILQLNNSKSWFPHANATESELCRRLKEFDIHITAAMWGENACQAEFDCAKLENAIAEQFPQYAMGFKKYRLTQERRSLRIVAKNLTHKWQETNLSLSFELTSGSYATSILREILATSDEHT